METEVKTGREKGAVDIKMEKREEPERENKLDSEVHRLRR